MKTWDKWVAAINWSKLLEGGEASPLPLVLLASIPIERDYWDTLELIKFNMN